MGRGVPWRRPRAASAGGAAGRRRFVGGRWRGAVRTGAFSMAVVAAMAAMPASAMANMVKNDVFMWPAHWGSGGAT